ncbi:unnamed protein product [Arabidopsis lyrata]|uniref:Uncharacterized protein n=1 Tax=Arabidopsis thaliana x Arabidopsis arenosa TaxID=1240361 RepID=A0A8T2BKP4_9BRAS|nr:hypothetical protein ISN45_Aa02g021420 [Arabidopsis thaliana x Arabidopsis arenosa]CAH8280872.1 unnamed protein product [Arabidopsis lyrata]
MNSNIYCILNFPMPKAIPEDSIPTLSGFRERVEKEAKNPKRRRRDGIESKQKKWRSEMDRRDEAGGEAEERKSAEAEEKQRKDREARIGEGEKFGGFL